VGSRVPAKREEWLPAVDVAGYKAEREDRLLEKRGRTLLAKIWDQHVIARIGDDTDLLHVDRHLLHDLGGSRGLAHFFESRCLIAPMDARAPSCP
jgi:hypothetical protein